MRSLRLLLLTTTILLLFTFPAWFPAIGGFLVVSGPLTQSDALVVLAGAENERLAYGAELISQRYADWFVLTDMHLDRPNSNGIYAATVRRKAILQGVPEDRILIAPGNVATTYQEVLWIKAFTLLRGFHSLILVTSPYHTRRARLIFDQVFRDTQVAVSIQAVPDHWYHGRAWWRDAQARSVTALEYTKIIAQLLCSIRFLNLPCW
jgi:uncharacterized SAM-binding protein YcdF (DUF218 family)